MERELGLSYPTVRGRLNAVIAELGYEVEAEPEVDEEDMMTRRKEILDPHVDLATVGASRSARFSAPAELSAFAS